MGGQNTPKKEVAMIDKLYNERDDRLGDAIDKINEIIDVVNALPNTGFATDEQESDALNEALDPHS